MRKFTLKLSTAALLTLFAGKMSFAQIVGSNAYIKGSLIEVGISGAGGFEGVDTSASPVPSGMHPRTSTGFFGFVANPQNDMWTNYNGDFFTPGSPENGWGFEVDSVSGGLISLAGNNCSSLQQINGAITQWSHIGSTYLVTWEGDEVGGATSSDIHFIINYNLEETNLYYITTVTVTNNSTYTFPAAYYYRNVDPDNNEEISADYTTQNTIISQGDVTQTAQVSATSAVPWFSYYSLASVDSSANWRASYGGFSNRDGSDIWNGVGFQQGVDSTNFADEAIELAYKITNLAPGASQTFKFASIFDTTQLACALSALDVNFAHMADVNVASAPVSLTGGTPAGGTYSGPGVVGGNMFDPSSLGIGTYTLVYTYSDGTCTNSAVSTVHVTNNAGVYSVVNENSVKVYPNPFSSSATIEISKDIKLDNAQIKVYDMLGREVSSVSNVAEHKITLNRDGLTNGVYFIKLYNAGSPILTKKMIIQ